MNKTKDREPSQSDRFMQTARDLECDESEERFNEALKKVAKAKPVPDTKPVASDKATKKDHL